MEYNISNINLDTFLVPIRQENGNSTLLAHPLTRAIPVHTHIEKRPKKETNWLYYGCSVAALALIALGAFLFWWPRAAQGNAAPVRQLDCTPSSHVPQMTTNKIATENGSALANIAGYVTLLDDKLGPGFLALNVHSIYLDHLYNGPMLVTLEGDCVSFIIEYKNTQESLYDYKKFELAIKRRGGVRARKWCEFTHQFVAPQPAGQRYSCLETQVHMCSYIDGAYAPRKVAQLVLTLFELELAGDPMAASRGEFSREPWPQSCEMLRD